MTDQQRNDNQKSATNNCQVSTETESCQAKARQESSANNCGMYLDGHQIDTGI